MIRTTENSLINKETLVVILITIVILIVITICIPFVYITGRLSIIEISSIDQNIINPSKDYWENECTKSMSTIERIFVLINEEPFPYTLHSFLYRPSPLTERIFLIFGFRHDFASWSLDNISFIDETYKKDLINDGDFELNYLNKNYRQCILSSTRNSISDILSDNPYSGDYYYNDETKAGMNYLIQTIGGIAEGYYNISFYLENRGYAENYFVFLIGS
ncbi:unnamed protein product [Rotaria sordida]|uniref:Uncharacterized protein n=1 Tax=Rotaria sordida TaxID=392033 RepID=A0A818V252_9BILA|nr:unnamed protein product [Rotaria sordida]CAF3706492.1 unnamed protein product [Rotaria sordida]